MSRFTARFTQQQIEHPIRTAVAMALVSAVITQLVMLLIIPDLGLSRIGIRVSLMTTVLFPVLLRVTYRESARHDVPAIQQSALRGTPIQDARLAPAVIQASESVLRHPKPIVVAIVTLVLTAVGLVTVLITVASDSQKIESAVSAVILGLVFAAIGYGTVDVIRQRARTANQHALQLLDKQSDEDRV